MLHENGEASILSDKESSIDFCVHCFRLFVCVLLLSQSNIIDTTGSVIL